jgi:phosphoribosylglycinamide formyltransferase-1
MLNVAVLVSGGGTNLQALIDAVEARRVPCRIALVVSSNPKAYALERAAQHGLRSVCLRRREFPDSDSYDNALIAALKDVQAELVVLAGYLPALGPAVIRAFSRRIINIHPSLIPSFCGKGYYGIKVHEAALARGVKLTGATVHFVDEGVDTGPILLQKAVDVLPGDTPEILQRRVMEQAEWVLLPEAVKLIAEGKIE